MHWSDDESTATNILWLGREDFFFFFGGGGGVCGNFATRMVEKKNCVCVFLITATRMQSTFVVIDTLPVACF